MVTLPQPCTARWYIGEASAQTEVILKALERAALRFERKATLTNRTRDQWDVLRTKVWAASLMAASGTKRMDATAFRIAGKLKLDVYNYQAMKKYADGAHSAGRSNRPGITGLWVDRAEVAYPGTSHWYTTPLWFLLQAKQCTPEDLRECILLLPASLQRHLVRTDNLNLPAVMRLGVVPSSELYLLTELLSPWTLGALACAMRQAELAADVDALRLAGIALLWSVNELIRTSPPILSERLLEVKSLVDTAIAAMIKPHVNAELAPITADELDRFGRERTA